ncbi:uncharacterized protein LOC129303408 [Prosopis cineraria]|uniref:uncharacterized protein LOC129303408 n=1 Tax=Prosopis cineraria TaxID=364024 RepID=UPI00240EF50F|nr:uncharacterized protein LOC129303408 [Prosopis cineraria]
MAIKRSDASIPECCMCGDPGFSDQLFQCKFCHFRSQHRYCSSLFPKARFYATCNWCLIQTDPVADKSPNSSNSSSSFKDNSGNTAGESSSKKAKNGIDHGAQFIGNKRAIQLSKPVIRKQRSPEVKSPPPTSPPVLVSTRKRIITNGDLEERPRRSKSEDKTNRNGITKQVFRNKVRRYKLLEEVIS